MRGLLDEDFQCTNYGSALQTRTGSVSRFAMIIITTKKELCRLTSINWVADCYHWRTMWLRVFLWCNISLLYGGIIIIKTDFMSHAPLTYCCSNPDCRSRFTLDQAKQADELIQLSINKAGTSNPWEFSLVHLLCPDCGTIAASVHLPADPLWWDDAGHYRHMLRNLRYNYVWVIPES